MARPSLNIGYAPNVFVISKFFTSNCIDGVS